MHILLVATGWGPQHGGINSFNKDFAEALATELRGIGKVTCCAANASDEERQQAALCGVDLIPFLANTDSDSIPNDALNALVNYIPRGDPTNEIWVGHDIVTGEAAYGCAQARAARSVVIMHMSAISYQAVKHRSGIVAHEKHKRQRELFQREILRCAIGPLLMDACRCMVDGPVHQLIPGFPKIGRNLASDDQVAAITFGRLDPKSDRMKNGRLAVAAWANAIKRHYDHFGGFHHKLSGSRMYVLGLSEKYDDECEEISRLADEYAERRTNIIPLPFTHDRKSVLDTLRETNLAILLPWQEGFGLTGWEAIAAEVPLITSRQTGLFRLIDDSLGGQGTGCLQSMEISGGEIPGQWFSQIDLDRASILITHAVATLPKRRHDAKLLKSLLERTHGCTWAHTAQQFLCLLKPLPLGHAESQQAPFSGQQVTAIVPENPFPELCELMPGLTQGSSGERFDLAPELRFGMEEIESEELSATVGLTEASARIFSKDCLILGERLGDRNHPNILASGNNLWRLVGPLEGNLLARRTLGEDVLCSLQCSHTNGEVSLEVTCKQRHLHITPDREISDVNKRRVVEILLKKGLGQRKGEIVLSRSRYVIGTLSVSDEN